MVEMNTYEKRLARVAGWLFNGACMAFLWAMFRKSVITALVGLVLLIAVIWLALKAIRYSRRNAQ